MAASFNIDEILQMAIQIERNGGKFYRLAADMTADTEVRKSLLMLASMEDDHETTFETLREKGDLDGFDLDLDGQAAAYLQAVADGYVFDVDEDPAKVLAGDPDAGQILHDLHIALV